MISLIDLLALHSLPGVGDQTIRKIIRLNLTTKDITKLDYTNLSKIFTSQKSLDYFTDNFGQAQETAEFELENYSSKGITVIHYFHKDYSPSLALLEDFPIFLFCRGNTELLKGLNNIAVIGTRECSEVGAKIARSTAIYFAERKYTIVSGLAKGIDAVGHKAALDVQGHTIAVLIDVSKIYPKENSALADAILDNKGLLISENKPGSFQGKNSFVLRDRLQSGLSLGVFPIETDIKGGTMHTVRYATKQRRLLFVPDMFNPSIRNQYLHSVGPDFDKTRGIIELINTQQAFPYTKDDYSSIENKLQELVFELEKSFHFLNPEDLRFSSAVEDIVNRNVALNQALETSQVDDSVAAEIQPSLSNTETSKSYNQVNEVPVEKESSQLNTEILFDAKIEEIRYIIMNFTQKEDDCIKQMKTLTTQINSLKAAFKKLKEDKKSIEALLENFQIEFGGTTPKTKSSQKLSLFDLNLDSK